MWDDLTIKRFQFKKLNLHSKIVLTTSTALLIIGTILFFILEYNNLFKEMPFGTKLLNSFFSAVTPRTAGFNTVDIASLTESSKLLTVVLMFVGRVGLLTLVSGLIGEPKVRNYQYPSDYIIIN